jgi:YD repeat-containing protein
MFPSSARPISTTQTVGSTTAFSYTCDNANRLTQVTRGTPTVSFSYDSANRRTALTLPNGVTMSYSYDNASELTGISYATSSTSLGSLAYGYDMAGRRTSLGDCGCHHPGHKENLQEAAGMKVPRVCNDAPPRPFISLLSLPGKTNPTFAFVLLIGIVLYQVFTGGLLNLKWKVWATRKERPGIYWTVIVIELTVCVLGICIGTL